MKRKAMAAVLALLLLWLSAFSARAVSFAVYTEGTCRPGKTVEIAVSMLEPGNTAAFLVTMESDALTFVQAVPSQAAKNGYTRAYSEGNRSAFVYTAADGAADFSGEAVRFVFRAPAESGQYTVQITVSQVADAGGNMTDTTFTETVAVTVAAKAPDTPPAEAYTASSKEETPVSSVESTEPESKAEAALSAPQVNSSVQAESAPEESAPPLQALSGGEGRSFLLGMGASALVFAVGVGLYVLLARPKEPPKKDE